MAPISDDEKREFVRLTSSASLKEEMELLAKQRHNPFMINGEINMDRVLEFMTDFNEFINHEPKPFKQIIDKDMRL